MSPTLRQIGGVTAALWPELGPSLGGEAGALEVIGDSYGLDCEIVVIPLARLTPESLDLSSRELGFMAQKFATYGLRVAFVGQTGVREARSQAFSDFRRETNRGGRLLFARDLAELDLMLARG